MLGRLRLDDALSQLESASRDSTTMFEGWSEARVKAYRQIESNPNSYYYRFNAPGEQQRNGQWTTEEKEAFRKRMEEKGADGQWGVFSMAIPGRVGYQCSNYYRGMIKSGKIVDPNYEVDEKGGLHYLFGKKEGQGAGVIRKHTKSHAKKRKATINHPGDSDDDEEASPSSPPPSRKSRKSAVSTSPSSTTGDASFSTRRTRAHGPINDESWSNPLPGFTDPITLDQVIKPAISPYGHVMGYDSWCKCLSGSGSTCPLTKKPLSKRELVLLTFENIEEYREKIVNM